MLKIISALIAIGVLNASAAHAEDLKIGCVPKEQLTSLLKSNKQSLIEQYMRKTGQGEIKTTITGLHDDVGYPDKGRGYIIETRSDKGCVIAKTRIQNEPGNKLSVATVHSLGDMEMTSAEWRQAAKYAQENKKSIRQKWINEGKSPEKVETVFKAYDVMSKHGGAPDDVKATFLYLFSKDGVTAIKRSEF